ncbi:MAG: agmatinase family protein [Synergistaceae bacterium]|nr:agmatinase family protein [Synergistaceae bacterium]
MEELREGDIAVAGIPFDTTCGSRQGARFGPRGIREGSLHFVYQMDALNKGEKTMINAVTGEEVRFPFRDILRDTGDLTVYPADVEHTSECIRAGVEEMVSRGAFPVLLGGDHYVTFPAVEGFERAWKKKKSDPRLGYIHIDSHLDLSDDTEVWGKHYHGSTARRVSELDSFSAENMVWIGASGGFVSRDRWDFLRNSGAVQFSVDDMNALGISEVVNRAVTRASEGCDSVYVTIDIDVVDHAFAPGTGSYVYGGITSFQFLQLMDCLRSVPAGALDLVEVAPPLDPTGTTSRLAATGLIRFLLPKISGR